MKKPFDTYKILKSKLALNYKGYKLEQAIAIFICLQAYKKNSWPILSFIKILLCKDFNFLNTAEEKKCLFTIGPFKRSDYYEIYNYVKDKFTNKEAFCADLSHLKHKVHIRPKNIIRSFTHVFCNAAEIPLRDKIKLSIEFCFMHNSIDNLEKEALTFNKYVAFSSIYHWENLLTQYFQKKEKATYSLQHGVTYLYTKNIPLDAIMYENLHAKYAICWGQYTKDELIKYGFAANHILIGGYPRKTRFSPVVPANHNNRCLIFLSRESYLLSNIKLMSIIAEFSLYNSSIAFDIKLHPTSDHKKYADILHSITKNEVLPIKILGSSATSTSLLESKNYSYSIVVNTSVYYEAYLHGLCCFRFEDGSFDQTMDVDADIFTNTSTLLTLFNKSYVPGQYNAMQIQERLRYSIGAGIDNYYHAIMHTD